MPLSLAGMSQSKDQNEFSWYCIRVTVRVRIEVSVRVKVRIRVRIRG